MKQTINFEDFCHAFHNFRRYEQFGYNALEALFNHLEDIESDTGEEMELDVIAICCDYTAYPSAICAMKELSSNDIEGDDDDEREKFALEWLQDHTTVIEHDDGIVVQAF